MKKLLKILVVLLVLAAIAVGVKFFFFRNSAKKSQKPLQSSKQSPNIAARKPKHK